MKKNIINVYDNYLKFKLPTGILEIIDEMLVHDDECFFLYKNIFSGIELYYNHLYQENIRIRKKYELIIGQIPYIYSSKNYTRVLLSGLISEAYNNI